MRIQLKIFMDIMGLWGDAREKRRQTWRGGIEDKSQKGDFQIEIRRLWTSKPTKHQVRRGAGEGPVGHACLNWIMIIHPSIPTEQKGKWEVISYSKGFLRGVKNVGNEKWTSGPHGNYRDRLGSQDKRLRGRPPVKQNSPRLLWWVPKKAF